jgi:hypothetical protein
MADQNQKPAATATPPSPSLITAADISYEGCFRLPKDVAASTLYAYGGLTGRRVNGELRFLITGSEAELDAPIMEVVDPGKYHKNYRAAPQADFTQQWDKKHRDKRGTWRGPLPSDRAMEPFLPFARMQAINRGMYWHEPTRLLYLTYADTYNVAGFPDWGLIGIRLNDDQTTETFGPWRVKATDSRGTWYGPHRSMFLGAHPQSGKLITGTSFSSGNANFPWGPDLYGDLEWPTPATPSGVRAPDLVLGKRYLEYYYMGGLIDAASGQAKGPVRSFRRRVDPPIYEYFPATPDHPGDMATNVNPARYGGVGSWGEMDYVGGLVWIETPTKRGVLFCGNVAGSPIQDPKDSRASHCWYTNVFKPKCSHGFPTPLSVTGPVSTAEFPFLCGYDPAILDLVAKGEKTDYEVEPAWFLNLTTAFNIQTAGETVYGGQRNLLGFHWDAERNLLFALAHRADDFTLEGLHVALVHAFRIKM